MSQHDGATRDPLIGRKRELDELVAGLGQIRSGYGRVLLVDGEPGIGKTRLAQELAYTAAGLGMRVLWGACPEGEGAPALWPWVQIVREAVRAGGSEPIAVSRHVARLLGGRPSDRQGAAALGSAASDEPFELFDEVTTLLRTLAEERPLLLVLDDLHWADRSSLRLLQFVSREIRLARVGVLGTWREPELRSSSDRMAILAGVLRSATHVSLRGLSLEETGALLDLVRGEPARPALVAAVHQASGGSPFFARELGRLAGASVSGSALPLPEGVRATLRERLGGLSPECREALAAASVLGPELEVALLEVFLGASPGALLGVTGEAVAAAVLVEAAEGPGRLRFAHSLIRDTLYADLAPAVRAELHDRAGRAIERVYGANLGPHLESLASHFDLAGRTNEAVHWKERAGLRAFEVSAYDEAVRHFERALALSEGVGAPGAGRRGRLLFSLGQARKAAGDYAAGNAELDRAVEAARNAGDAGTVALAELERAGYQRRFDRVDATRVKRLEVARGALDPSEPALLARLDARLAFQRWLPGAEPTGAREALALARASGDPLAIGEALFAVLFCIARHDLHEEGAAILAEILEITAAHSFSMLEWQARMMTAWQPLEAGDLAGFRREVELLAAGRRRPVNRVNLLLLEGAAAYLEGRFDEAAMRLREADELARRFDHVIRGTIEFALMEPERMQGRLAGIEPRLASLPPIAHWKHCLAASIHAALGRHEDARRELDALGGLTAMPRDLRWLANLCDLAEACVTLGDRERMLELRELLLPWADRLAVGYISILYRGSVGVYLGLLEAALGLPDDARRHLEAGLAANERVGVPQATAFSRLALAEHLMAEGERGRAAELAGAALATARELGMKGIEERATALVASGGKASAPAGGAVLRNEGEYWTAEFGGQMVRLKDSKGLRDLAELLARPGHEVHVADLIARDALAELPAPTRMADPRALAAAGLTVSRGPSSGELLDARARAEYRSRLAELRDELEEAESANDRGRAEKARQELDFLAGELASAYGLGGRGRSAGDPSERARKAVGARIRYAIGRIGEVHPVLARHLDRAVRTGTLCSYEPDEPVSWAVQPAP